MSRGTSTISRRIWGSLLMGRIRSNELAIFGGESIITHLDLNEIGRNFVNTFQRVCGTSAITHRSWGSHFTTGNWVLSRLGIESWNFVQMVPCLCKPSVMSFKCSSIISRQSDSVWGCYIPFRESFLDCTIGPNMIPDWIGSVAILTQSNPGPDKRDRILCLGKCQFHTSVNFTVTFIRILPTIVHILVYSRFSSLVTIFSSLRLDDHKVRLVKSIGILSDQKAV